MTTPWRRGRLRARLVPAPTRRRWLDAALLVVPLLVAATVLTFTRGLNTSFERTPPDQVEASDQIYAQVRDGDAVALPFGIGLTPFRDLTTVPVVFLDPSACANLRSPDCLQGEPPRFIVLSVTQEKYGELTQSRPPGWLWRFGDQVLASGAYRRVLRTDDVWLLELVPGAAR